ncbi:hypothetical protein OHB49_42190 [Streptomyces sp. NBC_01717]|uniref:hypothetical protein n=1 Tax=Streptomyces sp. NBC_01717 TaxID=2975918 RepID=UPI002E331F74|nr:hypothetical protein [Streptomyces sp. NBC_01717]
MADDEATADETLLVGPRHPRPTAFGLTIESLRNCVDRTVSTLDSELADLHHEHTSIRLALLSRFDGLDHNHI